MAGESKERLKTGFMATQTLKMNFPIKGFDFQYCQFCLQSQNFIIFDRLRAVRRTRNTREPPKIPRVSFGIKVKSPENHVARNSLSCRPNSPYEDSKKCARVKNQVRVKCETEVVSFDITENVIQKLYVEAFCF